MMAVMGPILGAVPSDAPPRVEFRRRDKQWSKPSIEGRPPRITALRLFHNQPAYPTNRRDPRSCWQFSLPRATLRCERRRHLNGKDPTFDAGFAVPGVGSNPEATGLLDCSGHRDQSRL